MTNPKQTVLSEHSNIPCSARDAVNRFNIHMGFECYHISISDLTTKRGNRVVRNPEGAYLATWFEGGGFHTDSANAIDLYFLDGSGYSAPVVSNIVSKMCRERMEYLSAVSAICKGI